MYDNVTQQFSLPVLIPATAEQQEGVATFEQELGAPAPVRCFKDSDLKDAAKHMTEAEALHFHAVIALTRHNCFAENAAFDEAYRLRRAEPSTFAGLDEDFAMPSGGLSVYRLKKQSKFMTGSALARAQPQTHGGCCPMQYPKA